MKLHNKLKFVYLLFIIALFFGCGSGETTKEPGGTLTIHSPSFPEIQGMISKVAAYLQEDFAGFNCPLIVDTDTTLSGQCSDIPNGTHTYTLKYVHKDTGVILATAVVGATMEPGQNHDITFPSPVYGGYDDDSDGYANLLEIANGSNPKDPNSHPYDITPPATPLLTSPTTGSSTGNDKPAFDWTDVADPSGVSYEIQVDNDSDFSSLAINEVGLTASNYTITYPLADGTYFWRVRARDGSGNIATDGYAGNPSGWSGSWSITVSKTVDTSDTTPPTITTTSPANNAVNVGVTVSITATFNEIVPASTINTTTFTLNNGITGTASLNGNGVTATFTPTNNLAYNTTYTATITTGVTDTTGNSMPSNYTWSFTTEPAPVAVPSAPNGVTAAAGDGQATISWNAVSGATSYNLYWSTTSGVSKTSYAGKISNVTSPYIHTGLTNGTTYYYVVTGVNSSGESVESSPPVSAIPQAIPVLQVIPISLDFGSSNTTDLLNISNTGTGTLTWSITDDKTWLTVTPSSGDTTTETDTLTVTVDRTGLVRGSDTGKISITSNGGNQYIQVTMSVSNHVPVITSSCPTTAQINAVYTCDVNATDGDGDTLTYSLTTAPSGMTIDPNTGVISWTSAVGGSYSVTVSVNDGNGGSAMQEFSVSAGSYLSGIISTNTTWTCANSPYIVSGSILVNSGVTLTIEPCVTVKFDSGKALQIDGTLIARGNSTNKITFTSNQSTPTPGDWGYILFSDSSTDAVYDTNGNYTGGSVLEYCTVEYAGGANVANNGAVRMDNAHPFINYCIIRNNGTSANGASGIRGYNLTGTLKITNNTISNNNASNLDGGGIYASGSGAISVLYNTVGSNTVSGSGGGVFVSTSGTSTILNNNVGNNTALNGGGIVSSGPSTISNNTINSNTASGNGGGIYVYSVSLFGDTANVFNNTISNNTATGSGGGIYAYYSYATISNNIVSDNTTTGSGGGISYDGHNWSCLGCADASVTLSNNAFINNAASSSGGGIYVGISSSAIIFGNIIAGNIASGSGSAGGGIYGGQTISNNTIFNNSAYYAGGMYSYTAASNNTITGNRTTGVSPVYTIYSGDTASTLNNNNIFGNTTTYELFNWNAQGTPNLNAENNWWGSAIDSQYWVYDWLDDPTKGIVDYDPWCGKSGNSLCAGIRTDVPISPPAGLTATAGTGQISLTWTVNQEADTAGYRVYWSTVSGSPYVYSADVSGTNYTIPGLSPGTYYVTVTAYDTTYNAANDDSATYYVNENQTNGNESWYAVEQMVTVP